MAEAQDGKNQGKVYEVPNKRFYFAYPVFRKYFFRPSLPPKLINS